MLPVIKGAEKLLLLASTGREFPTGRWLQQFLTMWVMLAVLVIITALLSSAMAIGGIYAVYLMLLGQGYSTLSALFVSVLIIFFTVILLAATAHKRLRRVKSFPQTPLKNAIDAFLDGLFYG